MTISFTFQDQARACQMVLRPQQLYNKSYHPLPLAKGKDGKNAKCLVQILSSAIFCFSRALLISDNQPAES